MDDEEKKTFLEKVSGFLDVYLFNRINILMCGVLAGMSLAKGEAMAACGWLCACLAWSQSNVHRSMCDRMFGIIASAVIGKIMMAKNVHEDEDEDGGKADKD